MKLNKVFLFFLFFACFAACQSAKKKIHSQVVIHQASEFDMLNPLNYAMGESGYALSNIFASLLTIDCNTLEPIPALALSRPLIVPRNDARGLLITYQIRPEARFDNGDPILGKDIEFTVKVVKNPFVNCPRMRTSYEFIEDVRLYPEDPRKITFVCKDVFVLAEAQTGDIPALPSKIYDPLGILSTWRVRDFNAPADSMANNARLRAFGDSFNSEKFQRDSAFVQGAGPYYLASWESGQRITLKKKESWWGFSVKDTNSFFIANPDKIIYTVINDQTSAIVALKAGQIDVMSGIKAKTFEELKTSSAFTKRFNLFSPSLLMYNYLGMNTRLPLFSDKRTRQAIAHLVNVPFIIHTVYYDLAERVVGPVHPSKKKSYNSAIKPYVYDPLLASSLLRDAGWKDSNGDGVLDRIISGKRLDFRVQLSINVGNEERKASALLFQDAAKKVGIAVELLAQERSLYTDNMRNHRFEMFFGGWAAAPVPDDFKPVFASSSYDSKGANYTGFGSAASDALIDSIRVELNEDKRNEMTKRFQAILHEEAPCVFLFSQRERIAISKRFSNANATSMRPCYHESFFIESAE